MKRHEALVPLSREHHSVLILAQLLKTDAPDYKGLPTTTEDKAAYALKMYKSTIQSHFKKEEELMLKVKNLDTQLDLIIDEILSEHDLLNAAFRSLENATDLELALHKLGEDLTLHIRKEERVLFPAIEENCSEELLMEIKALFH